MDFFNDRPVKTQPKSKKALRKHKAHAKHAGTPKVPHHRSATTRHYKSGKVVEVGEMVINADRIEA